MASRGAARVAATLFTAAALVTALPAPASAAAQSASESIIEVIKEYEGFRSTVYWDSGKAFIGYGTICRSTDYPNGITREKAEQLLREAVSLKEASLNKILAKNNIALTQPQYDAVLDLSYNIGTAWMTLDSRIFTYLKAGFKGCSETDIVNAFGTWCHVGREISAKLVERRIRERNFPVRGLHRHAGICLQIP
jgi:GH24 family phage-related lysozyme (muramidase)